MQRDLDVLGRALGRSVDDAALAVHLVLKQLISLDGGHTGKILMIRNVSVCYALCLFLVDYKEYNFNNFYLQTYRAKIRRSPNRVVLRYVSSFFSRR